MRKTRAGDGERQGVTAPFPKSCASYFRFARFINKSHYTIWEPGTGYRLGEEKNGTPWERDWLAACAI